MALVTVQDAKTHLSRLLKRVEAGEEIVIARGRRPIARLVPVVDQAPDGRIFGAARGRYQPPPDDAFGPLEGPELDDWE
jgi:prevent-host-death family protein